MTATVGSAANRLIPIEGLRALAAFSVMAGHIWAHSQDRAANLPVLSSWVRPNLGSGLTLFFAISGFLLWMRFAAGILDGNPPRYANTVGVGSCALRPRTG